MAKNKPPVQSKKVMLSDNDKKAKKNSLKGKDIKQLTKAETDNLLNILAEKAGVSDSEGIIK